MAEARRRALERAVEASGGGDQSVIARPLMIPSRTGPAIPARTYHPPAGSGAATGTVVFFHGGGWVYGDLDSHDGMCRDLAAGSRCVLVAIDYRLAPEHPFPAGLDDARDALDWVLSDPTRLGARGRRWPWPGTVRAETSRRLPASIGGTDSYRARFPTAPVSVPRPDPDAAIGHRRRRTSLRWDERDRVDRGSATCPAPGTPGTPWPRHCWRPTMTGFRRPMW